MLFGYVKKIKGQLWYAGYRTIYGDVGMRSKIRSMMVLVALGLSRGVTTVGAG